MNRKERRAHLKDMSFIYSKAFERKNIKEKILDDGSIEFIVTGYATMTHKDYDGDIIIPQGADLGRIIKNNIVKRGHLRGVENNIGTIIEASVETDVGIKVVTRIVQNPEIPAHKEMIHGLRHGLIMGYSIGFAVKEDGYEKLEDGGYLINDWERHELSIVDIPNNAWTVFEAFEKAINSLSIDNTNMTKIKETTEEVVTEVVDETTETVEEVVEPATEETPVVEEVEEKSTESDDEIADDESEEEEVVEEVEEKQVEEDETEETVEEATEEVVEEVEELPVEETEKSVGNEEGVQIKELTEKVSALEEQVADLTAKSEEDEAGIEEAAKTITDLVELCEKQQELIDLANNTYKELGKVNEGGDMKMTDAFANFKTVQKAIIG